MGDQDPRLPGLLLNILKGERHRGMMDSTVGSLPINQSLQTSGAMEIIIVGAGIAGLSAGIGLRRAGHKLTVRVSPPPCLSYIPLCLQSLPD